MKTPIRILELEYGQNNYNPMTPNVIERGFVTDNVAYELATGKGINNQPIWGLSIVAYNPENNTTERGIGFSGCYESKALAHEAILQTCKSLEEI